VDKQTVANFQLNYIKQQLVYLCQNQSTPCVAL